MPKTKKITTKKTTQNKTASKSVVKKTVKKRKPVKKATPKKLAKKKASPKKIAKKKTVAIKIPVQKVVKGEETVYGQDFETKPLVSYIDLEEIRQNQVALAPEEIEENELDDLASETQEEDLSVEDVPEESFVVYQQKSWIMYVSIAGLMIAIITFWVIGVKQSLGQEFAKVKNSEPSQEFESLKKSWENFSNTASVVDQAIGQVQDLPTQLEQKIIEEKVKNDVVEQLKNKIEEKATTPTVEKSGADSLLTEENSLETTQPKN